ncbi:hypothetical protein [Halorientalis persicus]|nr:hypothetical protein [Halorientalis persicus]
MSFTRTGTVTGDGETDATRVLSLPRTATVTGDGDAAATRSGMDKARSATVTGDGIADADRVFKETFPSELTRDLAWDFDIDKRGFVSEWVRRTPAPGHGSVAAYAEGQLRGQPLTLIVEYDRDGDGEPDARSQPQRLRSSNDVAVFPSLSGGEGQYRVILRDIEPQDLLVAINIGTTHT